MTKRNSHTHCLTEEIKTLSLLEALGVTFLHTLPCFFHKVTCIKRFLPFKIALLCFSALLNAYFS